MANFNFPYIPENHRFALSSYMQTNKSVLLEHQIAKLYRCCLENFEADEKTKIKGHIPESDVIYAKFKDGDLIVSNCTFKGNGIFIQLAGKAIGELQLSAGQKWISESKDKNGNLITQTFTAA